ncbi:MAG TPA: LptA/OstA family protein [Armatimonadota bacterium]|jgi:lipopolysaccharide assembly outer membrane protein LptD (OstA)
MRLLSRFGVILILLTTFAAVLCSAQQLPVLPAPQKPAEPKYTEVKYWADNYSYKWEGEDRILVLTGNVKFVQGDTTILADRVDYRESSRTAVATGNLKITDPQNTAVAKQCVVNFKEKKCTMSGGVQLVAKPKPKPAKPSDSKAKQTLRDDMTVNCEVVDYFYKDKKAVIPGAVEVVSKTRTVTADSAVYSGKDEVVELVGNVKGRDDKDKHSFAAPRVKISLKDDNQWVEAQKASGTIYIKDEDEESKPAAQPPAAPSEKAAEKPAEKPNN